MSKTITPADTAMLLLHRHKLQLSIEVRALPRSKDPMEAWRFERVVHESWLDGNLLMKANGFARTQEEARQKAEALQIMEVQIDGLDVLVSAGDDLLRTEAYVPSLKMSIVQGREWRWRMPAGDLAPVLAPALHGLSIDSYDPFEPAGPALRGYFSEPIGSRLSAVECVAGSIADARKQISRAVSASRSFADRMDKSFPNF